MGESKGRCCCFHHYVSPVLVVLIALVFLLGNLNVIAAEIVGVTWPILLGLIGIQRIFVRTCRCCNGCGCRCGVSDHNVK